MNNKSKFLWLYCIALFTMAFILILISAVSHNRISKDVDSYKEALNQQKGLFQGVQQSLSSLTSENDQLKQKLKEEQDKNDQLTQENSKTNEQINQLNSQLANINGYFDNLLEAKKYFDGKQYKESAECLEQVDSQSLGEKSATLYQNMADTVFPKASSIHYNEGYKSYNLKKYEQAIASFQKSIQYKKDASFSDKANYFMAMSYLQISQQDECKRVLSDFINEYPNSSYIQAANKILKDMNQ